MTDTDIGSSAAEPSPLAEADLYERLKGWFLEDRRAQSEWYKEAESDFAFHAGHGQWEEADRQRLKGQNDAESGGCTRRDHGMTGPATRPMCFATWRMEHHQSRAAIATQSVVRTTTLG
jgi:hypothetical protein